MKRFNQKRKYILIGGMSALLLLLIALSPFLVRQIQSAINGADATVFDEVETEEVLLDTDVGAWYAGGSGTSFLKVPYSNEPRNPDLSLQNENFYGGREVIRIIEVIPHPACSMFPYYVEWGNDFAYNENVPIGAPGLLALSGSDSGDVAYSNYFFNETTGQYTRALQNYGVIGNPENGDYNVPMGTAAAAGQTQVELDRGGAYYRTSEAAATTGMNGYFQFVGYTDRQILNANQSNNHSAGAAGLYYINMTHVKDIMAKGNPPASGQEAGSAGINWDRRAATWAKGDSPSYGNGDYYVKGQRYFLYNPSQTERLTSWYGMGASSYTTLDYNLSFEKATGDNSGGGVYQYDINDAGKSNYKPAGGAAGSGYDYELDEATAQKIADGTANGSFVYDSAGGKGSGYYVIDSVEPFDGTAPPVKTYNVFVTSNMAGGTYTANKTAEIQEGETVELTATVESGYEFLGWEISKSYDGGAELADKTQETTTLTVGTSDVVVFALYGPDGATPAYTVKSIRNVNAAGVTVESGGDKNDIKKGDIITLFLTPDTLDADYEFVGWELLSGVAQANLKSADDPADPSKYTFEITDDIEADVVVMAVFKFVGEEPPAPPEADKPGTPQPGLYVRIGMFGDDEQNNLFADLNAALPGFTRGSLVLYNPTDHQNESVKQLFWVTFRAYDADKDSAIKGHYRAIPELDSTGQPFFSDNSYTYKYVGDGKGRFNLVFDPAPYGNYVLGDVLKVSEGGGNYCLAYEPVAGSSNVPLAPRDATVGDKANRLDYADFVTNIDWNGNVVTTNAGNTANSATDNIAGGGVRPGGGNAAAAQIPEYGAWIFVETPERGETKLSTVAHTDNTNINSNRRISGTGDSATYEFPLGFKIWVRNQTLVKRTYVRRGFYNNEWLKLRMLLDNPLNIYANDPCNQGEELHCVTPFNELVANNGDFSNGRLQDSAGGTPTHIGYDTSQSGAYNLYTGPNSQFTRDMIADFNSRKQIEIVQMTPDRLTPEMVYGEETAFVYITISPAHNSLASHWTIINNSRLRYGLPALEPWPNNSEYYWQQNRNLLENLRTDTMFALYDAAIVNPSAGYGVGLLIDVMVFGNAPSELNSNNLVYQNNLFKLAYIVLGFHDGCNDPAHDPANGIDCPRHRTSAPWQDAVNPYSLTNPTNPPYVSYTHSRSPSQGDGPMRFQSHMYDMYPEAYNKYYEDTGYYLTRIHGTDGYALSDEGKETRVNNGLGTGASTAYSNVSANRATAYNTVVGRDDDWYNLVWADPPSVNNQSAWDYRYFMNTQGEAIQYDFQSSRASYVPGSSYMFAGNWMSGMLFDEVAKHTIWEIFRNRDRRKVDRSPTLEIIPRNATPVGGRWVINVADPEVASLFEVRYWLEGTNLVADDVHNVQATGGGGGLYETTLPEQTAKLLKPDEYSEAGTSVKTAWEDAGRPTVFPVTLNAKATNSAGLEVTATPVIVYIIVRDIFNLS
ncbi:MAG: hypothetical protein LBI54_03380 [Lachnospiraceae bacterium]|jgi:hypothetical protein|nr:hypothetical protein [Lachnospiraceae bacterium]